MTIAMKDRGKKHIKTDEEYMAELEKLTKQYNSKLDKFNKLHKQLNTIRRRMNAINARHSFRHGVK